MTERGFTVLEILVALLIFAVVSGAFAPAFMNQIRLNHRAEIKSEAIAAANQALDALRLQDPTTLPTSGSTAENISIDGKSFAVTVSYCENADFCETSNNRHLTARVVYDGEERFATETVFTQLR